MLMLKAYAKLNLALNIVGIDPIDHYHLLEMINVPLELHDRIEIESCPTFFDTIITCDDPQVPTDESNLVSKAIKILSKEFNIKTKFRIHIHKDIPLGGGLAGGSTDAATVLTGVIKLLKLKVSQEQLINIAMQIGADVAYCLKPVPALVEGKGEKITPIKVKNDYHFLMLMPKKGLSTKEVYHQYDELSHDGQKNTSMVDFIEALKNGNEEVIKENMINHLETPAFSLNEQVKNLKDTLLSFGFDKVLMTGSGACVFAMDKDEKKIKEAAKKIKSKVCSLYITSLKD